MHYFSKHVLFCGSCSYYYEVSVRANFLQPKFLRVRAIVQQNQFYILDFCLYFKLCTFVGSFSSSSCPNVRSSNVLGFSITHQSLLPVLLLTRVSMKYTMPHTTSATRKKDTIGKNSSFGHYQTPSHCKK